MGGKRRKSRKEACKKGKGMKWALGKGTTREGERGREEGGREGRGTGEGRSQHARAPPHLKKRGLVQLVKQGAHSLVPVSAPSATGLCKEGRLSPGTHWSSQKGGRGKRPPGPVLSCSQPPALPHGIRGTPEQRKDTGLHVCRWPWALSSSQ